MARKKYDDNSIEQLKGADRVRYRPAAILGSSGIEGAKHTVIEIIGNATDEKLAGYGDRIIIGLDNDGSIYVRDFGRGVPMGWNKKYNRYNWDLIYNELYAGGKYKDKDNQEVLKEIDNNNGWGTFKLADHPYLITIGLNGLGAASAQFTSEYFDVRSYRDGQVTEMQFEHGNPIWKDPKVDDSDDPSGTYVHWKPDSEVFSDTKISAAWLDKLCRGLSYIAGFNVTFNNKGEVKKYPARTIADVLKEKTGGVTEAHAFKHITDAEGDICICDVDIAIGADGAGMEFYHNEVAVTGGAHYNGYASGLSRFFKDISKKRDVKIKEIDYSSRFSVIVSTLANKASMRNQTKDSIDDEWIADFIDEQVYQALTLAYDKGMPWLVNIVETAIKAANARIKAAQVVAQMKEVEKTTKKHEISRKFVPSRSYGDKKKVAETELYIVEGDSAGGQVISARNSDFQCVFPIRGKSLNVYKAPMGRLMANKEIQDIIGILGCGVDLGIDGYESFNINNLKIGKIIICSDADVDGYHIRMLVFNIIEKLFPELVTNGNLYVAEAPLYVINKKKGKPVYCVTQEELDEKKREIGDNIKSIDRMKGLGEMDKNDLYTTVMSPRTRSLRQIQVNSGDMDVHDTLEILFGKSTERRKQAILGSIMGSAYTDAIDEIESVSDMIDSLDLDSDLQVEEVEY